MGLANDDIAPAAKCVGPTWQINIGGPVACLVFEGPDASTMKGAVFSLWVDLLGKHGQQATRHRQSVGKQRNIMLAACHVYTFEPIVKERQRP